MSETPIAPPVVARKRRRRLPSRPMLVFLALIVAVSGFVIYQNFLKPQPVPVSTSQEVAVTRGTIVAKVNSTGTVAAKTVSNLSFATSGQLAELNVEVGQQVKKGEVLAKLVDNDLRLAVLSAEANLKSAEAKMAGLSAGSRSGEVAAAEAQLHSALANLDNVRSGSTAAQLQSAEASLAAAKANLQKAQSSLSKLTEPLSETDHTNYKITLEKARIKLHDAQAEYDKISWRPDAAQTPQAMALWQATTDYEGAKIAYDKAVAGPTAAEIADAEQQVVSSQAQVDSAQTQLDTLRAGSTAAQIAAAEASVAQAQSALDLKLNPTTDADWRAAEASLAQAQAALENARNNLDKAILRAPFDGVISAVNGSVGQSVSGTVATVLDMSVPQLLVTMTEADVAKVAVGQTALLTFDAFNGAMASGKVLSINPQATVTSGISNYSAYVSIEPLTADFTPSAGKGPGAQPGSGPPGSGVGRAGLSQTTGTPPAALDLTKLRAGMTGSASITYLTKSDVLVVPNRAIKTVSQRRVVELSLGNGASEQREVTTGAADESFTEIVAGLTEEDKVLIASSSTNTTLGQPNVRVQPGAPSGPPR